MSGSRALASARRRRAGPIDTPGSSQIPPRAPPPSPSNSSLNNENTIIPPSQKMTPAAMLLSHNKIIENLQTVISNLNNDVININGKINNIENKLEEMKNDENSSVYYKDSIDNMNNVINETKKHVLKVQTFSMETNLQFMEMKKLQHNKYDKIENSLYKNSDAIIELLSKIDNNTKDIVITVNNNIVEDNSSKVVQDNSGNVVEDNSDNVVEDNSDNVVEDNSDNVVEDNSGNVVEDNSDDDEYITMPDGKKIKKIKF